MIVVVVVMVWVEVSHVPGIRHLNSELLLEPFDTCKLQEVKFLPRTKCFYNFQGYFCKL